MYLQLEMYITGNGHEIRVIHMEVEDGNQMVVAVVSPETTSRDIEGAVLLDRWYAVVVDGKVVKSIHDALVTLNDRLI